MSWSTSELRVWLPVGAPLNWFKPSSKIFYWPFQGGTSFVDLLFFLSCVCYAFVRVCLYVPCGHLLGKGWPLGSRLWCLTVSLSLSHWYPGSGVVLDCIGSWSLHPYLLYRAYRGRQECNGSVVDCLIHYYWHLQSLLRMWFGFVCLLGLILYVPVNNLSVTSGWVFLGWTSTKLGKLCLAQTQPSDASEALTRGPSVSSQALYHWATVLPICFGGLYCK